MFHVLSIWSWTNDPTAIANVYSPRKHRRRGVTRALILALLPSLDRLLT